MGITNMKYYNFIDKKLQIDYAKHRRCYSLSYFMYLSFYNSLYKQQNNTSITSQHPNTYHISQQNK